MLVLTGLCVAQASAWACTNFGGPTVWDDQSSHVWTVSQSGTSLSGTEANTVCGTATIDPSNSTIFSGSITMKVTYSGCAGQYAWLYSSTWGTNCDEVYLNVDL